MGATRTCAVCGKEKSFKEFGDGISVPKTTCLACHQRIKEPKKHLKEKRINPVLQFLEELRKGELR